MTARADHVLVISLDDEMVHMASQNGEAVDPTDREFQQIEIRCEADREDFTRPCAVWWECRCELTEDELDRLYDEGDGACPSSPSGRHRHITGFGVSMPSRDCWAQVCDDSPDAVYDLAGQHRLGPGEYRIHVLPSAEYVEFELSTAVAS